MEIEIEVELIVGAILGFLLLTFGYHIKKAAFFVLWFILGYTLMGYLMPEINKIAPIISENELWRFLLPIAGGLLVGLLGFSIEKFCVGGICFGLVMIITARYFGTDLQTMVIGAVVGIVMAGLGVSLMRPATIVATAVAGSYLLTIALFGFLPELNQEIFYWPILIGLAVLGSGIQFATTDRE